MPGMSVTRHLVATARMNALRSGMGSPSRHFNPVVKGTLIHSPSPFVRRMHGLSSNNLSITRGISWTAFPKALLKVSRVPAYIGGAVAGGAAWVDYKTKQTWDSATGTVNSAMGWLGDTFDSAKTAVQDQYNSAKDAINGLEFGKRDNQAGEENQNEHDNKNSSNGNGGEALAAASAVAAATTITGDDEEAEFQSMGKDRMTIFTKKMIEIRSLLQNIEMGDKLELPSIVVVGSQSSGKSSVLEAIVGHEFLPKGSNMVTRRPIELTLINTPDSAAEYGEFPSLGLGKITEFSQVQKTLTDLNLAVSEAEAVSDDPIQLNIYSPNVPDLTMIDLPGYIQIAASDQPGSLKQKINSLCEKYIQPPNIILAISAADVDLANSSALKAAKRVDPRGERTIGVVTKMDLVDPAKGASILQNNNYPLQMGYVGVITRVPHSSGGLFRSRASNNIGSLVSDNERSFFSQYTQFYDFCTVGTEPLKDKLNDVLEKTMSSSLQPTADKVHQELEESAYQFKVEYNDRVLTPHTYLAGCIDSFKLAFKELTNQLGRNEVKKILKSEFDQRVLDLLAQRYWNKPTKDDDYVPKRAEPALSDLPSAAIDDLYWHRKLDASTSSLTKLGVGRLSTNLVINTLSTEVERLVDSTNFRNHPFARDTIHDATNNILNMRFHSTSDQVENCIKPYKYEVEIEDREWAQSRDHAFNLLKEELRQCDDAYNGLKRTIGSAKLTQVMKFIEKTRQAKMVGTSETTPTLDNEAFGFSQPLLQKGREAIFYRDRSDILRMRMAAVKSRQCKNKQNRYYCPEVFLDVVAEKLTQTAVLFLNVELLSDFYYNFPRELDMRLGKGLTDQQIEVFAKEDPKIAQHIELQRRKESLEHVLEKIDGVIELQKGGALV